MTGRYLPSIVLALLGVGVWSLAVGQDGEQPPDDGHGNGKGRDNITARHLLCPPADAADQDASGHIFLKRNPARNAIHLVVSGLEPGATYTVMIMLGAESADLGMITTIGAEDGEEDEAPGSGKLRLDTKRGDALPLAAESVADLVGATVQVKDAAGVVVLQGEIADLDVHGGSCGGDDDDEEEEDDGEGDAGAGGGEIALDEPQYVVPGRHDATFLRGDANEDGALDIGDAVRTLSILFQGASTPYCGDALDANDSGATDISDPVTVLSFLFSGGATLPPPSTAAGFDPTPDALFCESQPPLTP